MKKLMFLMLFVALAAPLRGRLMKDWTFPEMFAKSDLVVIAMPIATFETRERTALKEIGPPPIEVLGVNTEFEVRLVFKGQDAIKKFTLHHYKLADQQQTFVNGPHLVAFDSKPWPNSFLLFLVRERDGRYAPVTGQTDPALYSVIQLETDAQ
jgi:hypothetical protein